MPSFVGLAIFLLIGSLIGWVFFEMRFQGSDSGDRETAKRLRVLDRSNASVSSEFDRKDHLTEGRLKNSLPGARISEYLNI